MDIEMKMHKTLMALAIAGLASFAPPAMAATTSTSTFEIVFENGVVTPNKLEVPAGEVVKLSLHNIGTGTAEFESKRLRIEKVLAPGARGHVTLRKLTPGQYDFVDEFTEDQPTAHGVITAK